MKGRRPDTFVTICMLLMGIAVVSIGSNVLVVVLQGAKSLFRSVSQSETRFAIGLSVGSACVSTLVCFLLAVPTAYVLTRSSFPGRSAIEGVLELTMTLPNIVLGLSLLIIFASPFGKVLKKTGFAVVFNPRGVVIAQLVVNLPFAIKLASAAFRDVNVKLEHVAGLLGASPFRQFTSVLLPLSKNSLISAVILIWSRALGEFGATMMLVGVTRMKTETLPASIYLNVSVNDLDGALSSAFILLMISAISFLVADWLTRRGGKRSRYE